MSSLIWFEIKKFCNRRKNLLVMILFILLSVIFITLNSNLESELEKSKGTSIDLEIQSVEDALIKTKSEMDRLPDNEKLKIINYNYEEELNLLKELKNSYVSDDFKKYLECQIQLDKNLLINIDNGNVISPHTPKEISQNIELNTLLLEEGIKPIYTSVSMEGFNFIQLFLNNPISILIVIFIIILSADVVSSEFDYNTYKLLFTQPVSKINILLSKVVATLIMVSIILFGIITISFLYLGFTKGFGNINYPIQFYNNGVTEYITIGKFILFELLLFIILITFICILSIVISSFSKNTSNSIAVSIIVIVSGYMISSKGFFSNFAHLNPFIYFDISNVIKGSLATSYKNVNINFKYGLITLGLSMIILLVVNVLLFKKNNTNFNKIYKLNCKKI